MTPVITYLLNDPSGMVDYGSFSMIYSAIAFVNVVYTYGMETAYFRFSTKEGSDRSKLFDTTFTSLIISSILISLGIYVFRAPISSYFHIPEHPEYITWCVLIMATDALSAIPFAMLRQEGRPRKYAFVRVAGILVNILITVSLVAIGPRYVAAHPDGAFAHWYHQYTPTGFLLMANLAQAVATFLLLYREWSAYRLRFDRVLWRTIMVYSWPMVIVGMGGMINETVDRIMLGHLLPGTADENNIVVGIYSANYKISIFISLFIQAFKMSAEPFFFGQAATKNAPATYARVMKWFVITLCCAFLFTALYLDLWKFFTGSNYRVGLKVVPILLAANIALGIYYNLSVWYKITDKMYWGMIITVIGATITLVANWLYIPVYGMMACAWTTFFTYFIMMVLSYLLGQRYFPVPYAPGKLLVYIAAAFGLFALQQAVGHFTDSMGVRLVSAFVLSMVFLALLLRRERGELRSMPIIGKFL